LPYETVYEAVKAHPDNFHGLAGIDPTERMRAEVEALGLRAGPKCKFLRDNTIKLFGLDVPM